MNREIPTMEVTLTPPASSADASTTAKKQAPPAFAAAVTSLGVISPLGDDPQALFDALLRMPPEGGSEAFAPCERLAEAATALGVAPDALQGAEVRGFDATKYLRRGNLRPLDHTARLAAAAAARALGRSPDEDAPRTKGSDTETGPPVIPEELGLILGTLYGSVHTIAAFDHRAMVAGPKYAKPMDFANSVINAAAGQTAIWHQLIGINSTLSAGTSSGAHALAYAFEALRDDRARRLLAGGADELSWESYLAFHRAGLLVESGSAEDGGFHLGEGAALLCLEPEATASASAPHGRLLGVAMTFDPSRGEDPALGAAAVEGAVESALAQARRRPEDITVAITSASGYRPHDIAEAEGLVQALGDAAPTVAASAIRGALGEALGASGALQAAVLLSCLATGKVPGVACPIIAASLAQAGLGEGPSSLLRHRTLPASSHRLGLVTSLALDGPAAALIFEGP